MNLRIVLAVWLLLGLAFAPIASARPPWQKSAPYAASLMSPEEKTAYRAALDSLESEEEKEAYWREHVERMELRALEIGISPPERPRFTREGETQKVRMSRDAYFDEIMTHEERVAYHADLADMKAPAERQAYVRAHVLRMRRRGYERGVTVPSASEWAYAFESVGGLPPDDFE